MKSAAEVGVAVLERFGRANAERHEQAMTLRAAIRRLLEERPMLLAKQIPPLLDVVRLGLKDPPKVRTIQGHIKAMREASASR